MPLSEIRVPHLDTYAFGVGVDRLSGTTMNLAVKPTQSGPQDALGDRQSFEVSRVSSTHDMQRSLGIDADASYGCACFGAGVSARFSFSEQSEVHSSSLFLTITCTASCADLSIAHCELTEEAKAVTDRTDVFTGRYGDMFARACKRGGLFVGLMRVETFDEGQANSIETELRGSYGAFTADVSANFSKVTQDHRASVYCTVYAEGGPAVQLSDPTNPAELLALANTWLKAMHDDPVRNSVPYQWTLSPISIAEGPLPLNAAEYQRAQDVLMLCSKDRSALLDQLNQMNWWLRHQDKYDFSQGDSPASLLETVKKTQKDLDTVASCASLAMTSPREARMPTDYAEQKGGQYPLSAPPRAPRPQPGTAQPPAGPSIQPRSFNVVKIQHQLADAVMRKTL